MKETELRFRQIHLDFHTSESIESIGSDFDPNEFAETLTKALFKVKVRVRTPRSVRQVTVVPEAVSIAFRAEETYTVFEVERIDGHAMVCLTFG